VMQEPSKGDKIIEGQLKALTGGDPLTGRALYMDNVTFIPQFKLVVCTNEFMDVKSNDHGTWRRICVVEYMSLFTETPVSDDPDKPYQYKLDKYINEKFEQWAPIFAAMLVDRVYETDGNVNIPEMVRSASNAYREQQDYIAEFVHDRIVKSPTDCIQKTVLANVFKEWYNTNYGNRVPNMKEITTYMDKSICKQRNGVWSGVKIKFDSEFSRPMPHTGSGNTSGEDEDIEDIVDL
jgi:phage/plasmid-associated DNA primase